MKFNSKTSQAVAITCLALCMNCHAQEEDVITYTFNVLTLASDTRTDRNPKAINPEHTVFAFASEEKIVDMRLPMLSMSGPYTYVGPNPMKLFIKNGKDYRFLGAVSLDTALSKPLLIIDCVQSEADGIRAKLIDISMSRINAGDALLVNTTEFPTLCLLGDSKVAVPANDTATAKIDTGGRKMSAVKMAFFDQSEENWKRLYSTAHSLNEQMRLIVFLADSGNDRSPILFYLIQLKQDVERAPGADPVEAVEAEDIES